MYSYDILRVWLTYIKRGFKALTFRGIARMTLSEHSTTLLYRSGNNCLGLYAVERECD